MPNCIVDKLRKVLAASLIICGAGVGTTQACGVAPMVNSSGVGSSGQQQAFENYGSVCLGSSAFGALTVEQSFACAVLGGENGIPLQQSSTQAEIQAETVTLTSPKAFIGRVTQTGVARGAGMGSVVSKDRLGGLRIGAAGADSFVGPFGVSVNASGSFGDIDTVAGQTGMSIDAQNVTATVDYMISKRLVGGLSAGYLHTDRNLSLASGSLDSDAYRIAPFVSYSPMEHLFLTALGGYAKIDFDSVRLFTPYTDGGVTITKDAATADYSADQWFASLGANYTQDFDAWNLRGYARADYINTDVERYAESGASVTSTAFPGTGALPLHVGGQTIRSVTSTLGAELSHAYSTGITPRIRAEYVHEFDDDERTITAGFVNPTTIPQGLRTDAPIRNWMNFGLGVNLLFPQNIVAFVDYEALVIVGDDQDKSNHTILGGVSVNF